jgi:hypothetical protein
MSKAILVLVLVCVFEIPSIMQSGFHFWNELCIIVMPTSLLFLPKVRYVGIGMDRNGTYFVVLDGIPYDYRTY